MAIDIKFTKFDNTPWGFRLAGGSDFPQPLTVIRVTEGSLAECMGLEVGDVVVRLNDQPMSNLTHGKAHEALVLAGNNFVLGVLRGEESRKAVEAIQEENIVPYAIPLEELPPVFSEEPKQETLIIETFSESETSVTLQSREDVNDEELIPDKPRDADSEDVPNQNLTDDEIAQLILEEEELLQDQGVLGVNFKKLRPRAPLLKDSKVFEELQNIAIAEPPQVQELKRTTTFLQKPYRPVPLPKSQQEAVKVESYKVVIKKQQKKSITERLLEKGLLEAGSINSPEPKVEKITPSVTPEPEEKLNEEVSQAETKMEEKLNVTVAEENTEIEEEEQDGPQIEEVVDEEPVYDDENKAEEQPIEKLVTKIDKKKIKELVSTEISLEKQLENVQSQLLALKQLPSEIENHLKIVSEQLHKIMELSVQNGSNNSSRRGSEQERNAEEETEENNEYREEKKREEQEEKEDKGRQNECQEEEEYEEQQQQQESQVETEARESAESESQDRIRSSKSGNEIPIIDGEIPQIIEPDEDEPQEKKELEIQVKSKDEMGKKVKKFIVSYESKVLRSREPSPAPSNGSFEPDPNLAPKDQVIQELQQHRRGRKHSQDLWPQAKQLELTYGRRWRCPNDFFNDEMIAEVLSCQAEVIHGRALGINFKKYEKTNLPNYDHLMNSSVYRMVHKMEREPKKGIPVRPAKVNAAEDILERVKSPALSDADDRSNRSVSH